MYKNGRGTRKVIAHQNRMPGCFQLSSQMFSRHAASPKQFHKAYSFNFKK